MASRTIAAVHLYDAGKLAKTLSRVAPVLGVAEEIWFTSPNGDLLKSAEGLVNVPAGRVRTIQVDNKWNDWSGYLEILRNYDGQDRLIICNDSIASRRIVGVNSMSRFLASFSGGHCSLVGELDRGAESVNLGGWSSCCWVSTYLFGITGKWVDVSRLEEAVVSEVEEVVANPSHYFNSYLRNRPRRMKRDGEALRGKLGAMLYERWLTRCATESGATIINFAAGSLVRQAEKFLERFLDD